MNYFIKDHLQRTLSQELPLPSNSMTDASVLWREQDMKRAYTGCGPANATDNVLVAIMIEPLRVMFPIASNISSDGRLLPTTQIDGF